MNGSGTQLTSGWRTASFSRTQKHCVEVASDGRGLVRDSKDQAGPVLAFSPAAWKAFLRTVS